MLVIKGKYNKAKVFTANLEDGAYSQIENLCNQEFIKDSKIRIMPDAHYGIGCTIGTTMTITDKVVPNLVGVDIGCGIETIAISNKRLELEKLDKLIYAKIPAGFKIREKPHPYNEQIDLTRLRCIKFVNKDRAEKSIGTLGGGNHFIEVNQDEEGNLYLVVHSGSRHLGLEVANLYQQEAFSSLKKTKHDIPKSLCYLSGALFADYLHDMKIIQRYAELNRKAIVNEIVKGMKLDIIDRFTTIHNYIDTERFILRKGAVSAEKGEKFIIPINMRDGSFICIGKGNEDWNYSAPHGAGRLMSRIQAKNSLTLTQYKEIMAGIYTTSVNKKTLDECPLAYKPFEEIISNIGDTAEVVDHIKPIYNFKAAD
ncbi:MAG: RtcB family protein [Desulfitobacteriia bacterium]|jgi:tRNA-splicing ligase RtcB